MSCVHSFFFLLSSPLLLPLSLLSVFPPLSSKTFENLASAKGEVVPVLGRQFSDGPTPSTALVPSCTSPSVSFPLAFPTRSGKTWEGLGALFTVLTSSQGPDPVAGRLSFTKVWSEPLESFPKRRGSLECHVGSLRGEGFLVGEVEGSWWVHQRTPDTSNLCLFYLHRGPSTRRRVGWKCIGAGSVGASEGVFSPTGSGPGSPPGVPSPEVFLVVLEGPRVKKNP